MTDEPDYITMMNDMVASAIAGRTAAAKRLAARFQDLKGMTYIQMLDALDQEGIHLDFVTSVELYKALKALKT